VGSNALRWSSDVHRADWIAARLASWEDEYTVTVVVPAGFEAYARVRPGCPPAETGTATGPHSVPPPRGTVASGQTGARLTSLPSACGC